MDARYPLWALPYIKLLDRVRRRYLRYIKGQTVLFLPHSSLHSTLLNILPLYNRKKKKKMRLHLLIALACFVCFAVASPTRTIKDQAVRRSVKHSVKGGFSNSDTKMSEVGPDGSKHSVKGGI